MDILTANYKDLADFIQKRIMMIANHKGFSSEVLSAILGKSESTYRKYLYGDSAMSLEQFIGVLFLSNAVEVLPLMAKKMQCVVIPLPKSGGSHVDYLKNGAKVLKECGDVVEALGKGLADGKFSLAEKRCTLKQVEEALVVLVALSESLKADIKAGEDE